MSIPASPNAYSSCKRSVLPVFGVAAVGQAPSNSEPIRCGRPPCAGTSTGAGCRQRQRPVGPLPCPYRLHRTLTSSCAPDPTAGSDLEDLCFVRVPNAAANQWPSVAHDTSRWSVVSSAVRKGRFQAASPAPPERPLSALDPVAGDGDASSHPRVHRPLEQAVGPKPVATDPDPTRFCSVRRDPGRAGAGSAVSPVQPSDLRNAESAAVVAVG